MNTIVQEFIQSRKQHRTEIASATRAAMVDRLMALADEYAHDYAIVGDHSPMPRKRNELREALITEMLITELRAMPPLTQPNIRMSNRGMVVDQNYFWNYDMSTCPNGKCQLLSVGGWPTYGKLSEAEPGFYKAWAPLPKD